VLALLHRVLRDRKEDLIAYKCEPHVRRVAIESLEV
jgi:hypothetical protein